MRLQCIHTASVNLPTLLSLPFSLSPSPSPLLPLPIFLLFQSAQVIPGLTRLAMKLLGPCTLIQAAVPEMMTIPDSYHKKNLAIFEDDAKMCYEGLRNAPGLKPIMPAGAMYMMVHKPTPFPSPPFRFMCCPV